MVVGWADHYRLLGVNFVSGKQDAKFGDVHKLQKHSRSLPKKVQHLPSFVINLSSSLSQRRSAVAMMPSRLGSRQSLASTDSATRPCNSFLDTGHQLAGRRSRKNACMAKEDVSQSTAILSGLEEAKSSAGVRVMLTILPLGLDRPLSTLTTCPSVQCLDHRIRNADDNNRDNTAETYRIFIIINHVAEPHANEYPPCCLLVDGRPPTLLIVNRHRGVVTSPALLRLERTFCLEVLNRLHRLVVTDVIRRMSALQKIRGISVYDGFTSAITVLSDGQTT